MPRASRGPELLAEFGTVDAMLHAIDALRDSYGEIETYTPYDVPEVDGRLGLRPSRIGWIAVFGGVCGLVAAYGIQWWADVHAYPLNVGARPLHAAPAFLLVTFEGTVLGAALATFIGLLLLLGFPKLWAPVDEVEGFNRASIDRFWIAIPALANENDRERVDALLHEAGALRTVVVGGA